MNKTEFPGYREKVATENKKAAAQAAKAKAKKENALPPFLMIRGGVWDEAMVTALITVPIAEGVFHKYTGQNVLAAFCYAGLYSLPAIMTVIKYCIMTADKGTIQSNLNRYTWDQEYTLPGLSGYGCPRMARIMTQYKSKNNPKFFEKFMKNPNSVYDTKTAAAIIRGHIKSHPDDAQKVLDTFDAESMPARLYRQIQRHANSCKKHCDGAPKNR